MAIDYKKADEILSKANKENRSFLLEPEATDFLAAFNIKGSKTLYLKKDQEPRKEDIKNFRGDKVVVKVVSPTILHKTEVKGVLFPQNELPEIKKAIQEIYDEVPKNFSSWIEENPGMLPEEYKGMKGEELAKAVKKDIRGVFLTEFIPYDNEKFGHELLIGLQNSREFGPVITYGAGGIDTELYAEIFKERKAVTTYSAELLDDESIRKMIGIPAVYLKLSGQARDKKKLLSDSELIKLIEGFKEIGRRYAASSPDAEFIIDELEVNPFAIYDNHAVPIDALCRFHHRDKQSEVKKPIEKVKKLLKPASIAIIGVSQKMNIGHIILNNIIKNGFPKDKIYVIKDGIDEIEGAKCYPSIADLPEKVDLFIYTLPASMVPDITKDLLDRDAAETVIVISGGLGETKGGKQIEENTVKMIADYRAKGKPTPVFVGGNCMGIRSLPGKYDTLFIPEYKMNLQPEGGLHNLAYFSQSGAFMICRLSKLKSLNPRYSITTGNQMDLSITDFVEMLEDDREIKVYAVYIEGFDDLDGIRFAHSAKRIIDSGRHVVLYKAGRTAEGKTATSGHTSSIAGDYSVCKGVLEKIGVILPHNFDEFEDIVKFLSYQYGKKISGDKIGLVSNTGFEAVGMADNLKGDNSRLNLAQFSSKTVEKITRALAINKIDKIVEVHNPLDLTPMASDEIYDLCFRAILEEDDAAIGLISIVPLTWQVQALPPGEGHREDINSEDSIVRRLIKVKREYDKPFVAVVDCGEEYDPMVKALEEGGIPTFRTADRAIRLLRKFTYHSVHKKLAW